MDTMRNTLLSTGTNWLSLQKTINGITHAPDHERACKTALLAIRRITDADSICYITAHDTTCEWLYEEAEETVFCGKKMHLSFCDVGWALLNKTDLFIEDLQADERIVPEHYKTTEVKSIFIYAVRPGDPLGAIALYFKETTQLSEETHETIRSICNMLGMKLRLLHNEVQLESIEQKAQLAYDALSREFELFRYSVSHDLRAPLRAIKGFMTIFLEDFGTQFTDESKELAERIVGNTEHMNNLLNDLLEYFKAGNKELVPLQVQMKLMVEDVCEKLRSDEKRRYISISIGDLPAVLADADMIRQVWHDLISNAIKYTSKCERARIEIGSEIQNGETVYFIIDNGAGFDTKTAAKLFNVFQRFHSQKEFSGTGMGLAIAEKIISRHGGKIWAKSAPGEGAAFYFTLPAR